MHLYNDPALHEAKILKQYQEGRKTTTVANGSGERKSTSKTPDTFVDEIFGGVLESTITCHICRSVTSSQGSFCYFYSSLIHVLFTLQISKIREPFLDLSVPMPATCWAVKSKGNKQKKGQNDDDVCIHQLHSVVAILSYLT